MKHYNVLIFLKLQKLGVASSQFYVSTYRGCCFAGCLSITKCCRWVKLFKAFTFSVIDPSIRTFIERTSWSSDLPFTRLPLCQDKIFNFLLCNYGRGLSTSWTRITTSCCTSSRISSG